MAPSFRKGFATELSGCQTVTFIGDWRGSRGATRRAGGPSPARSCLSERCCRLGHLATRRRTTKLTPYLNVQQVTWHEPVTRRQPIIAHPGPARPSGLCRRSNQTGFHAWAWQKFSEAATPLLPAVPTNSRTSRWVDISSRVRCCFNASSWRRPGTPERAALRHLTRQSCRTPLSRGR